MKDYKHKEYNFYVYIMTNWNDNVMYIGMTNNLERRVFEHKHHCLKGSFTYQDVREFYDLVDRVEQYLISPGDFIEAIEDLFKEKRQIPG